MVLVDLAPAGDGWVFGASCRTTACIRRRTPWYIAPTPRYSALPSLASRRLRSSLSNGICLEIVRCAPIVLHLFHLCFTKRAGCVFLQPLDQADKIEAQVVARRCDGSFLDRFEANSARFGLDMALCSGSFDFEVVWWWGWWLQPIFVAVVHPLLVHMVRCRS